MHKNKHVERLESIDVDTKCSFAHSTVNVIECESGLNMWGDKIKVIDNRNEKDGCPMCSNDETWEHVKFCEMNKEIREEWIEN